MWRILAELPGELPGSGTVEVAPPLAVRTTSPGAEAAGGDGGEVLRACTETLFHPPRLSGKPFAPL